VIFRGLALVCSAVVLGCGFPVKVGELDALGDTTSSGETTFDPTDPASSSESGDPPPPAFRHDYAIRFGDLPDVDATGSGSSLGSTADGGSSADGGSGEGGSSGGGLGDPFDDDALVITATIGADTCEEPYGGLSCGEQWKVSFNLPPELQVVGAAGSLEDVNGFLFESGPLDNDGECFGGGGSLLGQFEITAIDDTRVSGRLFELEVAPFGTELDFDAPRCG
jgi:hypothetical protein